MKKIKTSFSDSRAILLSNEEFYPVAVIDCPAGDADITERIKEALADNESLYLHTGRVIEILLDEDFTITDDKPHTLFNFTDGEDSYEGHLDFIGKH